MQDPPPLEVAFEGRKAFSEAELRRAIEGDLERYAAEPRPAPLDDAVFRLTQHYRSRGYADVEVTAQVEGRRVLFRIVEKSLFRLGRIHFKGNTVYSDDQLKDLLERSASGRLLPYSKKLLALQVETILAAYAARGNIECAVAPPGIHVDPATARVHVTYDITEGRSFTIASVGPPPSGLERRFAGYAGAPYDPSTPAEVEATASDHLRELGHPHPVVVATPKIDRDNARVTIALDIRPGPVARIGEIEVNGTDRTRKSFVQSRAALVRGRLFRASDVREAERRLLATGLFRQVRVTAQGFQEERGEVPIEIFIQETMPGEVSIRGGTGSLDGPRVGADVAYQNLLGMGVLGRVGGTVSRTGGRGDVELAFPWFLGTDFRPGLSLYYEAQQLPSFDVTSHGLAPSLVYPFSDRHTVTAGWRLARIRTNDVDPGVPPGDLLDFEYRALFLATSLDFRNSTLLPTRGARLAGSVEWAPPSFASDIEFFKGAGRLDLYAALPWDLVFAVSFQAGLIRPLAATDEIPISLRYFAGGANTVRGFKYGTIGESINGEPTGGESFLSMQAEVRFPIWGEFHGAVFSDRGGVWLDPEDTDLDDTRWSVGTGLRYHTPAGALSADLAWNVASKEDEDHVVFHFSIGFPF